LARPGAERIASSADASLHERPHPILTDSGGFQVMSLAKLRRLDENGVTFQSHLDGSTQCAERPERAMEIQALLGSDIQMQLDECDETACSDADAERAMRLSLRWAERSRRAFRDGAVPCSVRNRAGRRRSAMARRKRQGARRQWIFTVSPSAASRSASRKRSCWRRSKL